MVVILEVPIWVVRHQAIEGRLLATTEYDYGWVAKVLDRAYERQNGLIYRRLGFIGILRMHIGSYGSLCSLRVFWVLSLLCLLLLLTMSVLCLYEGGGKM
jgi:hypothetical protein